MKNGDVFRGQIIEQEFNEYIQLRFDNGNEKRLNWSEIKSVKKTKPKKKRKRRKKRRSRKSREREYERVDDSGSSAGSGLATAGWLIFGITYGATVIASFATTSSTGPRYSLIPLAGPFLQLGSVSGVYTVLNIISGVLQPLGIILAIIGHAQGSGDSRASLSKFYATPVISPDLIGGVVVIRL